MECSSCERGGLRRTGEKEVAAEFGSMGRLPRRSSGGCVVGLGVAGLFVSSVGEKSRALSSVDE